MATEVKIPTLGESISSGILASWHVKSGDYVEKGQTLFELETDKITSEGTAEEAGVIELKVDEGDEVEVGSVVAVIDENASKEESEDSGKEDTGEEDGKDAGGDSEEGKSGKKDKESDEDAEEKRDRDEGKDRKKEEDDKKDHQHPSSVRRIAEESGIDPDEVEGSGKGGRVTKEDMQKAVARQKEQETQEDSHGKEEKEPQKTSSEKEDASPDRVSRKKMTPLRRTIAKRLVEAQQTTAMLTTFNEVDMSAVMNFRKTHQESFVKKHEVKLGFMSFFTKAVVHALKAWPSVNARIEGEEIVTNNYYDIGIAVSTPKGLLVPVVRDCDQKSFARLEKDIIDYANKAKEGKISIEDLQGGVFTITNGGVFGSMLSTPILNTPQSGILGMHTIQERPVAVDGEVVIRPMMYLALSYDHRLVDGREAVGFLVSVKQVIEDPMRLMFEI